MCTLNHMWEGSTLGTGSAGPRARGLDLSILKNLRIRGDKVIAQCPVCAAEGRDSKGQHLVIFNDGQGAFSCIAAPRDKVHNRAIAAIAGLDARSMRPRQSIHRIAAPDTPRLPDLGALQKPTERQLEQIVRVRNLPTNVGLHAAVQAGQLWTLSTRDFDEDTLSWVLTDSARVTAQARRMDGRPWRSAHGAKAKTLKFSTGSWPIGSADIGPKPFVALCEGGPDTLAVWTLAALQGRCSEIAPVCMAGATMRIHPKATPYFRGKGVWIYPHSDDAGARALAVWSEDLRMAGVEWIKPIVLTPHKDLNEFVSALMFEKEEVL